MTIASTNSTAKLSTRILLKYRKILIDSRVSEFTHSDKNVTSLIFTYHIAFDYVNE